MSELVHGAIEVVGRMPWSSNATFLVHVGSDATKAVYKPGDGERPLWDFPDGLFRREVAAYLVSEALGWGLVPETVLRHDGPLGSGSLQRFVEADFEQHYFTLLDDARLHPQLLRIAVFDLVANNADRKSGHCLIDGTGHVWGVDQGLCFHTDPKLRTVIWDFGGCEVPQSLRDDCARLAGAIPEPIDEVLHADEIDALRARASAVSRLTHLPDPPPEGRPYPWPLV